MNIFVSIDGVEVDVNTIADQSMSYETYMTVRANTEGFNALLAKLNNSAIAKLFEKNYEPNASYRRYKGVTYNDAIIGELVPELLKRLPDEGVPAKHIDKMMENATLALSHKLLKMLTKSNAEVADLKKQLKAHKEFYNYFANLYRQNLQVANWHKNDDFEPFDSFFDSAEEVLEEYVDSITSEVNENDITTLPLGTRFHVTNGNWYGRIGGTREEKTIFVESTGETYPLTGKDDTWHGTHAADLIITVVKDDGSED
jgi:regulator of replication initiation timing